MADITEHHTEEERIGDDGDEGGVTLTILRHTVRVDELLESIRQVVQLEVSGRADVVVLEGVHAHGAEAGNNLLNFSLIVDRGPEETGEGLVLPLHHVQVGVESLLLGEEHLVNVNRGGGATLHILKLVEILELAAQDLAGPLQEVRRVAH